MQDDTGNKNRIVALHLVINFLRFMKKLMTLCAAMLTLAAIVACKNGTATSDSIALDIVPEYTSLFEGLQYNDEGIAFIKDLQIVVDNIGRYDFGDAAPVYAGKWGCTAVDFDYCDKHYYIPVDEDIHLDWPGEFPFAASVTIKVWRDYEEFCWKEDYEEHCYKEGWVSISPFALITDFSM